MASFSLGAMFGAVHEAIVNASQDVEQSAWQTLKERYFIETGDGSFEPKTIRIKLPHAENGKVTQAPVDVPLFSLSKHGSLVIDELNMKFDVDLKGLDKKDKHLVGSLPRKFLSSFIRPSWLRIRFDSRLTISNLSEPRWRSI